MASVAIRTVHQVVLMLRFGFPKLTNGLNFSHHLAWPKPGRIDIGDSVQRLIALHIIHIVNGRPIRRAAIIPLT
jgi:hypothetical protein